MIEIILPGPPQAWTAPKITRNGHSFSPKYQQKLDHQCLVRKQYFDLPISGAVRIKLKLEMPIPKSTSKKMLSEIHAGVIPHIKKPDIDNCIKYSLDVIKGIVILDDNQVNFIACEKIYSTDPKVTMTIAW